MNFTENAFIWFMAGFVALWWCCRGRYWPTLGLIVAASLFFYAYHEWTLAFLILAYCAVTWILALPIPDSPRRKAWLTLAVALNLLGLAYWKYALLLVRSVADLAGVWHLPIDVQVPTSWVIPIGISFYCFTCIAYLVDVYRGEVVPERNLLRFVAFITFFPQLVAGPILRAQDFLKDLQPATLPRQLTLSLDALMLIGLGCFKKMVLADRLGLAIDPFFSHIGDASTAGVWSLPYVWLYALQIYFDFSGYTDIARGLGLAFGFHWPENFNLPYLAASIQDFWRRWHMTLSSFLRDYLYIPLGGSRCGPVRAAANLMLTMLLGGLWHGASWSFMVWGGLHGGYLVIHKLWSAAPWHGTLHTLTGVPAWLYRGLMMVVTFHAVCLAWCFFRLQNIHESVACVRRWFDFAPERMWVGASADPAIWTLLAGYGAVVLLLALAKRYVPSGEDDTPDWTFGRGLAWGSAAALIILGVTLAPTAKAPPFIYFQF